VQEIILVDDGSELDHLRDQLDQYITRWNKVDCFAFLNLKSQLFEIA
jgi:hypothetical protein